MENRLPGNFSYLITDFTGDPILEQKVLKLGPQCRAALQYFSHSPEDFSRTVVLHGHNLEDSHYDVMVSAGKSQNSPIFFVSFKVNTLLELLKNAQIPGQSLLVVNNSEAGKIELSAQGVFQSAWHGKLLNDKSFAAVLYKEVVPGTGWSILAMPDSDLFSTYRNKLLLSTAGAFLFLLTIVIIFLWRLWIEENFRLIAENNLKRSNEELEQKVFQRTRALKKSEQDLLDTFMSAPYGMLVIDEQGIIELINKRATDIFGYDEKELLNMPMNILLPENIRQLHDKHRAEYKKDSKTRFMGKGRHLKGRKKNGREFPVEIGLSPIGHSDGIKVIVSISDISELVMAEQKLMEEHERAIVTLNSIGDGVITTDIDGEINSINPVAERLSGWQEKDAIGRHISQVFMAVNEKTGQKVNDPVIECLDKKAIVGLDKDTVLIHRQGMVIPIEDSAAPILSDDGLVIGAVLVFHDVSQSRAHANEVEFQASHDALTGLMNRREFDKRLEQSVIKARETGNEYCVLFMDLDRFKRVNDSAGHAAGDELLRQITTLMGSKLRQRDAFARLGGDEFAVILEHCSKDLGLKVADKLRSSVVDYRLFWKDNIFNIGVSIGVVPFSSDIESADELLGKADAACYAAKKSGRNRVQLYDPSAV